MSDQSISTAPPVTDTGVVAKLSTLDRWLPVWILAAMVLGLALGRLIPGTAGVLNGL